MLPTFILIDCPPRAPPLSQSAISRAATKLHPLTVLGRQLGTRLAPPSTTTSSGFLSFMFGAPSPGPAAAAKITQEVRAGWLEEKVGIPVLCISLWCLKPYPPTPQQLPRSRES